MLKLIEEHKNTIIAKPKGGGDTVEIEKEIVRPFLFGKDIERWKINWKGWYVIFPYKKYEFDGEEKYKLIPSKEYKNKFDYEDGFFEDIFPKGWSYLKSIEKELRNRENGKFKKGKTNEDKWYSPGYPRNIEKYDKPKLLVQTLADNSKFVYDEKNNYVFAGAGGSNVFGILPKDSVNPWLLLSLLNCKLLEYYNKHISNIFSGKFYSYGDQFIKLLPIKELRNHDEKNIGQKITSLAKKSISIEDLKRKIEMFPTPYFSKLRKENKIEEFFEIKHIIKGSYPKVVVDIQKALDGNKKLKLGKNDYIDDYRINSDKKYEYVIRSIKDKKLSKGQEIILRIPLEESRIEEIIKLHNADQQKLKKMPVMKDLDEELNRLAYKLYGVDKKKDIESVENFLERF